MMEFSFTQSKPFRIFIPVACPFPSKVFEGCRGTFFKKSPALSRSLQSFCNNRKRVELAYVKLGVFSKFRLVAFLVRGVDVLNVLVLVAEDCAVA